MLGMKKPTTELTVAGLVNKIRRLERLRDYLSFTVASISPDFSPVLVFKSHYIDDFLCFLYLFSDAGSATN
jgi:hypothetical protein